MIMTAAPNAHCPVLARHDAICGCSECYSRPREPLTVVPWQPSSHPTEPEAVLRFGDMEVRLGLSYFQEFYGLIVEASRSRSSAYRQGHEVAIAALHEMEVRMWKSLEMQRAASTGLPEREQA